MSQFPLHLPEHIMEQARAAAREEKISINQLLLAFIAEGLGHRKGMRMMKMRAERANPEKALEILDRLQGTEPEPGDEMPKRAARRVN